VARHHGCLTEAASPAAAPPQTPKPDLDQLAAQAAADQAEHGRLVERTRQRYEQVQALSAERKPIKAIVRELGLARETVRRFARAQSVEDLLTKARIGNSAMGIWMVLAAHQALGERDRLVRAGGQSGLLRAAVLEQHDMPDLVASAAGVRDEVDQSRPLSARCVAGRPVAVGVSARPPLDGFSQVLCMYCP